jgi:hypothetical protein
VLGRSPPRLQQHRQSFDYANRWARLCSLWAPPPRSRAAVEAELGLDSTRCRFKGAGALHDTKALACIACYLGNCKIMFFWFSGGCYCEFEPLNACHTRRSELKSSSCTIKGSVASPRVLHLQRFAIESQLMSSRGSRRETKMLAFSISLPYAGSERIALWKEDHAVPNWEGNPPQVRRI